MKVKKESLDAVNSALEREHSEEMMRLCQCGHSRVAHLDFGHYGSCELLRCDCKKYRDAQCQPCFRGNHKECLKGAGCSCPCIL